MLVSADLNAYWICTSRRDCSDLVNAFWRADKAALQVASPCNVNVVLYGDSPAGIFKTIKLTDVVSTQRLVNEVAKLQSLKHLSSIFKARRSLA
jgi:hypothetical protein